MAAEERSFAFFRDRMKAELVDHAARTAEAQVIEDEETKKLEARTHDSADATRPPPDYELRHALEGNYRYARASRRRDAAMARAIMYGVAALVEAYVGSPQPRG